VKKNRLQLNLSAIFVACTFFCSAQQWRGQHVVTAGAGFSLDPYAYTVIKNVINPNKLVDFKSSASFTPVIFSAYDYGADNIFSAGISYSYQAITVYYNRYSNDTGYVVSGDFHDDLVHQNFAVRPMFHLSPGNKLDLYAGARIGYSMWSYVSASNQKYSEEKKLRNRATAQVVGGFRYYFSRHVGFNTEFGIGPPYFAMFGVNVKFGKSSE
jgi:hypothetical protein